MNDEQRESLVFAAESITSLTPETREAVRAALAEIDRLTEIVDKLPKTADGVTIATPCTVYVIETGGKITGHATEYNHGAMRVFLKSRSEGTRIIDSFLGISACYSTREAAEKASEK